MPDPNNADDDTNELEGVNIDDATTDDTGTRRDNPEAWLSTNGGNSGSETD